LKPTVIGGVPTVFDRIHDRIISQIQSSLIAKLLWKLNVPLLRTFIYDRIKAAFGGRLRLFASSGAPLRPQVAQLLCECIAPVLIIYGATETGCSLCTMPEVPSQLGTIGVPIPGIRVKLDPVEDFAKDHEDVGEIWVSGPSVCDGYLGEAADDFTSEDGGTWFRTGDIAKKNADGTFSIIDRRKNFVKTSHGEYVALQHVEKVLTESPIVESIWCYADPSKPSVVAVVAVNEQHMREDLDVSDVDQACENPEVQKAVVKVFENLGKQRGLRTFEIPKAVYLQKKPFSMEEGEVTPTFKLVRRTLQQRYKQQLDSLYESIGSKSGGDGQSAAGKATSPRSNGSASSSSTAAQNAKATPSRAM
jgi:long-chain acyl-CoA synthetase